MRSATRQVKKGRLLALLASLEPLDERLPDIDEGMPVHALALGLIVVSGNDREFARVPGLAVDNWLA